jgi:hypothetical protein
MPWWAWLLIGLFGGAGIVLAIMYKGLIDLQRRL